MSKCILHRASLSRWSLGPSARFRVAAIGRAVGGRWSRRRSSPGGTGLDVLEFRVLNFVGRFSPPAAKRLAVTVNFAEGVIPSRLGARQHPVEPFETIELALHGL